MSFLPRSHEEAAVVRDIETSNDRAAAIIAASLLESEIERTIISHTQKNEKITADLFRPSGPLGTFSVKIDVAFLLGIYTEQMRRELVTIKEVRNAFAHKLDIIDFASPRIRDLTANLKMVETYVDKAIDSQTEQTSFNMTGLGDRRIVVYRRDPVTFLDDPRNRFLTAAHVFRHLLAALHEAPIALREPTL